MKGNNKMKCEKIIQVQGPVYEKFNSSMPLWNNIRIIEKNDTMAFVEKSKKFSPKYEYMIIFNYKMIKNNKPISWNYALNYKENKKLAEKRYKELLKTDKKKKRIIDITR